MHPKLCISIGFGVEDQGLLFAAIASMGVGRAELKTIQEAQQADPILRKYFDIPKAKLTHRGIHISPEGNSV